MKKRKKLITVNNRNFENYEPWVKGLVFGGVLGMILLILIIAMIAFFDYILTIDYFLFFIPLASIIIGSILGILFFRKYN
jgi:hypothetical protein